MHANQTMAYAPETTIPQVAAAPAALGSRTARTRAIRVLVVDHHPVVQLGIRQFLAANERFEVGAGADSAASAIDIARRERPDIALLEPNLPDMLLEELVEHLRASSPNTKLIVFAAHISPTICEQVARLGLHGLVSQSSSADEVSEVVTRVAAGEIVEAPISEHVLLQVAEKLHCAALTAWEHEILRHAARGASNAEIAAAIFLAPTTVKSYLQSALGKLGARNRAEAVFRLGELGLL